MNAFSVQRARTLTANGERGTSRPLNLMITRYSPSIVGVYTHAYVCFASLLGTTSHCAHQHTSTRACNERQRNSRAHLLVGQRVGLDYLNTFRKKV